jgi:hypothetical protein
LPLAVPFFDARCARSMLLRRPLHPLTTFKTPCNGQRPQINRLFYAQWPIPRGPTGRQRRDRAFGAVSMGEVTRVVTRRARGPHAPTSSPRPVAAP